MKPSPAKSILALLLCQVLTVTQVFAIAGGPPLGTGFAGGGGTTTLDLTGTYSGVLLGLTETSPNGGSNTPPAIPGDPVTTPTATPTSTASSSIGLFDLGVTSTTGLATGTFLLFSDGRVFTGTISGAVDPGTGSLRGILQASFNFNVSSANTAGVVTTIAVTASALGRLDASISGATTSTSNTSGSAGSVGGNTATSTGTTTLVTLSGTASLSINFGEVDPTTLQPVVDRQLTFSVNGVRNSTSVTLTAFTAGTGG